MERKRREKFMVSRDSRPGRKSGDNDHFQKKSLGQVFLREPWPCERVVAELLQWRVSRVLEIGPGKGALTTLLLKAGLKVTAVEKDARFAEYVRSQAAEWTSGAKGAELSVVETDILDFDLSGWLPDSHHPKDSGIPKCAVVGNIPYNISTPIFLKTFSVIDRLAGAIFLTQLEFAERIAALPGGKEYGSLSVLTSLHCLASLLAKVSREAFTPVPKVDSALVSLVPRAVPFTKEEVKAVESVSRRVFQQRRKMLRNTLAPILPPEGGGSCPIDLMRRPETLSLDEFITLAKYLDF